MDKENLYENTTQEGEPLASATDDQNTNGAEAEQAQQQKKVYGIVYNGAHEDIDGDDEVVVPLLQKGRNYDKVQADLLKTREESQKAQKALDRMLKALGKHQYQGSPDEIADILEAQAREIDPEQVRQEREARESAESAQAQAEEAKREMQLMLFEAAKAEDLAKLRTINPNLRSIDELGPQFIKYRQADIDAITAYQLVTKSKTAEKPQATGKEHLINVGGSAPSGGDLVDIPASELSSWKDAFPDDNMKKLKERYNRYLKR